MYDNRLSGIVCRNKEKNIKSDYLLNIFAEDAQFG